MTQIPSENELFGIMMDDYIFRAAREIEIQPNSKVFNIYLIDYGEIIEIDFDQHKIFHLNEEQSSAPAEAILCLLDERSAIRENTSFFNDCLYTEFIFVITNIQKNILTVDLKQITNPFHQHSNKHSNVSKFYSVKHYHHTIPIFQYLLS